MQYFDSVVTIIVKTCHEQYESADSNIKRALNAVLRELIIVRRLTSNLKDYLSMLMPDLIRGLLALTTRLSTFISAASSSDSALKTDALTTLGVFVVGF